MRYTKSMKQNKPTGGVRLQDLIENNCPPLKNGVWLDTYNGIWNSKVSGTIKARIDGNCMYYVTQTFETD